MMESGWGIVFSHLTLVGNGFSLVLVMSAFYSTGGYFGSCGGGGRRRRRGSHRGRIPMRMRMRAGIPPQRVVFCGRVVRRRRRSVAELELSVRRPFRRVMVYQIVVVMTAGRSGRRGVIVLNGSISTSRFRHFVRVGEYFGGRWGIPAIGVERGAGGPAARRRPGRRQTDRFHAFLEIAVVESPAVRMVDGVVTAFVLQKRGNRSAAKGRIQRRTSPESAVSATASGRRVSGTAGKRRIPRRGRRDSVSK